MTGSDQDVAQVPPRLRMQGIGKRFGATVALEGVDLEVRGGQVHALVGENGAGKSTLMKILSGALSADQGRMWLDDEPFTPRHPLAARRAGVAMIYQELSLCDHLSVQENILLGMESTSWGLLRRGRMRQRAAAALAQLGQADLPLHQRVGDLAPAGKQLVEIARAAVSGCRLLVLDEPTSSLGRQDVRRLFGLIARLKQQGQAVIYISHFLEEVQEVADRLTVLRDGRVVGGGPIAETSIPRMVAMMVGREVNQLFARSARQPGPVLLEVDNLAGLIKPRQVTLTLRRGEVLGLAGLVGAGRTELLRALFGLEAVRSGRIRIGAFFGPASPVQRWAQGVGLLSEDRKSEGLALGLSVADNLTLSHLRGLGPAGLIQPKRQDAATQRWIERLGIRCRHPRQPITDLSGGNQQKVALARLLHHDVDILLLDEPTRGIDVGSKAQVYQLIDALASGPAPKAVLVVSSYLPELLGVCDRIAVMCRGRLGAARPAGQWDEHALMLEATGQGDRQ